MLMSPIQTSDLKGGRPRLKKTRQIVFEQILKLRHQTCLSSGTILLIYLMRHVMSPKHLPMLLSGTAFAFSFAISSVVHAQARVDLEDMSVKGELLNDNRMRMSSREATRVQDRVKYRKNFRPEIIDGIDVRLPAAESLDEVESK